MDQPGRLLDKDTLLKTVWPDTFVEENNLADNIFKLRRVLGDGENGPRFIETVPKRGYRFVADVRAVAPLTEQGPGLAPQLVAEPSRQAEHSEGQVPLPVTNTRRPVTRSLVGGRRDDSARRRAGLGVWPSRDARTAAHAEGGAATAGKRQLR